MYHTIVFLIVAILCICVRSPLSLRNYVDDQLKSIEYQIKNLQFFDEKWWKIG